MSHKKRVFFEPGPSLLEDVDALAGVMGSDRTKVINRLVREALVRYRGIVQQAKSLRKAVGEE